jgi:hypothetical protein
MMHKIMEFILPILFASSEAMIWILLIVILIIIGKGKLLPSERMLVIERKGQYRMVLAPGLNLAQPFIEAIARQVSPSETGHEGLSLYFEVRDKQVATRKQPSYLLEICIRDGVLHFETRPVDRPLHQTDPDTGQSLAGEVEKIVRTIGVSWGIGLQRVELPV